MSQNPPCPNCGQSRESATCPDCGQISIALADSLDFNASLVVTKISGGQTTSIRVLDDAGRNVSADNTEQGTVSQQITAPPRVNEANVAEVCTNLMQKLNEDDVAAKWVKIEVIDAADIDAVIQSNEKELAVQVTRPAFGGLWKTLANTGAVSTDDTHAALAEALYEAIKNKQHSPLPPTPSLSDDLRRRREQKQGKRIRRPGLILAIDCIETPGVVMGAVIRALDMRYGDWMKGLAYTSIWAVGPVQSMTYRLK
jgi:hypothetical protein